jgi:Ner family transcriptional regulator
VANPTPDWPPDKIKAAVYETGISLEALALSSGFSSSLCRMALKKSSPAGEKLISQRIGVRPEAIWPSRYAAHLPPRVVVLRRKSTHRKLPTIRQKEAVA